MVEDENGNIVRETMKDNDVLTQYKNMRETLVYLSNLDHDDTERQMLERLRAQMAGSWTWNGLNTLCWAIGSISGSMAVRGPGSWSSRAGVQSAVYSYSVVQFGDHQCPRTWPGLR